MSRWLGVFDVGTVINARTAASQLRGGIITALTEQPDPVFHVVTP